MSGFLNSSGGEELLVSSIGGGDKLLGIISLDYLILYLLLYVVL